MVDDRGFREFDEVSLISAANVRWLFTASSDERADLRSIWTVASVVGEELVLSRNELLIRIPQKDVRKVSAYSIDALLDHIRRSTGYG